MGAKSPVNGSELSHEDVVRGGQNSRRGTSWKTIVEILGESEASAAAREELEQAGFKISNLTWQKVGVASMFNQAAGGNVQAFVALSNIADGKPTQRTEHSGPDGGPQEHIHDLKQATREALEELDAL